MKRKERKKSQGEKCFKCDKNLKMETRPVRKMKWKEVAEQPTHNQTKTDNIKNNERLKTTNLKQKEIRGERM